jgi:hypothetical protein
MRIQKKPEPAQSHAPQFHTPESLTAIALTSAAVVLTCALAFTASMAQTPDPDVPSSPAAGAAPPPQSQGAADALGSWVQQSSHMMQQGVANVGAGFGQMVGAIGGQANQATRDAADVARNAAVSVSKLPNTGITAGHELCAVAPNGAPDCGGAAATLCRANGFASGTSVDFVTVENCPPEYRASRREVPEGVCTKESYVTKALCQ